LATAGDEKPPGFQRAYHPRNIRDEDELISFGLFDMTTDESPACTTSSASSTARAAAEWTG
jgi:hypothetical protein